MTAYECSACGKKFASDKTEPRCPKCLRRTSVKEAALEPPPAEPNDEEAPAEPAEASAEARRSERLLVIAVFPALLAAFLRAGFFKVTIETPPAIAIAALGGIAWAVLAYRDLRERARAGIAAVVASSGMVLATAWYLEGRPTVFTIEVLVPMILGAAPGLVVYAVLRPLVRG